MNRIIRNTVLAAVIAGAGFTLSACSTETARVAYSPVFDCKIDYTAEETTRITGLEEAWKVTANHDNFCLEGDFPAGQNTMTEQQKAAVTAAYGAPQLTVTNLGHVYRFAAQNSPRDWRVHSIMVAHEADWARGVLVIAPNHPQAAQIRAAIAQWENFDSKLTIEEIIRLQTAAGF